MESRRIQISIIRDMNMTEKKRKRAGIICAPPPPVVLYTYTHIQEKAVARIAAGSDESAADEKKKLRCIENLNFEIWVKNCIKPKNILMKENFR